MAREVRKLSARTVASITRPGRHSDGAGLYLMVDASGARRWLFMFRWQGKLKEMGLGGFTAVSLAEARDKSDEARRVLVSGRNPIEARRTERTAKADAVTFGRFADELVPEISREFRNEKHRWQWSQTLRVYAAPLRDKPIADIHTDDVLSVLKPLWSTKQETASRLRGRIERVLDAAKARGLRAGENPARWRGHLDHLLPRRQKLSRGHHAAMPFQYVPSFVADLCERDAIAARALEFLILNASRSGEVIGCRWQEIDEAAGIWTIPASRMKAGREHRVPLSGRALAVLAGVRDLNGNGEYVFPGRGPDKPMSNMAMDMLLRRMKLEVTVHGFRSSFRDWAGETTSFPREIAELALAHVVGDETERAYRRGDALERRRELMTAWSGFIADDASVIQLHPEAGSRLRA